MPETRLIRWTAPAAEDLREITRYIRRDNPTAARTVAKPSSTQPTASTQLQTEAE